MSVNLGHRAAFYAIKPPPPYANNIAATHPNAPRHRDECQGCGCTEYHLPDSGR